VEVSLADHHKHVEGWAREYATRVGLPAGLVELIATAARAHDLGKADARFQADLRGFSALFTRDADLARVLMAEGEPLAKSKQRMLAEFPGSTRIRAVPEGFRHEVMSVALAQTAACVSRLTPENRDLVLWLIGTHHGYGRPFFPSYLEPDGSSVVQVEFEGGTLSAQAEDVPLRLDRGWFELAERVNRRYGPWELARLEAILRLADHAASAAEQEAGADGAWKPQPVRAIL
jgi:CRISPR-associated endonuclease/helicase Cas3